MGTNNANGFSGRVDQNFGANNTLWFRYSFLNGTNTTPNSEHATGITSADQRNWGGGYTHSFSPTLILDAIAGYSGRFNTVSEDQTSRGDLNIRCIPQSRRSMALLTSVIPVITALAAMVLLDQKVTNLILPSI